jgi:hypothetical protein
MRLFFRFAFRSDYLFLDDYRRFHIPDRCPACQSRYWFSTEDKTRPWPARLPVYKNGTSVAPLSVDPVPVLMLPTSEGLFPKYN